MRVSIEAAEATTTTTTAAAAADVSFQRGVFACHRRFQVFQVLLSHAHETLVFPIVSHDLTVSCGYL